MFKTSQKRSFLQKLKETTDIGGKIVERFSPEMKKVFEGLKEQDKIAREKAINHNLDLYLKQAKSSYNRRDFITTVYLLSDFHTRVGDVSNHFKEIDKLVQEQHKALIFKGKDFIPGKDKETIKQELKKKFESKSATDLKHTVNLIKTAGLLDYLKNKFTASAWEKRYPKQTKKLKEELSLLLDKSNDIYNHLMKLFHDLGWARANRKIEEYVELANDFMKQYQSYDNFFKKFYEQNVAGFLKDVVIPKELTKEEKEQLVKQITFNKDITGPSSSSGVESKIELKPETQQKVEHKKPLPLKPVSKEEELKQYNKETLEELSKLRDEEERILKQKLEPQTQPQPSEQKTKEKELQKQEEVKKNEIKAGDVVDFKGFGAQVLEVDDEKNIAKIRLINSGTEHKVRIDSLKKS